MRNSILFKLLFPLSHFLISSQKEDEERKKKEEESQRNAAGRNSSGGGGGKEEVRTTPGFHNLSGTATTNSDTASGEGECSQGCRKYPWKKNFL